VTLETGDFTMALRPTHLLIGAAALASLALAACNLNSSNNTAANAAPDNSAPPVVTNSVPADNSASNATTNAISNAALYPRVGGGDNQH
jgi:hypothetical protein